MTTKSELIAMKDKVEEEIRSNLTCPYCNKLLFEYNGNGKRLKCLNKKCKGRIKDFPEDEVQVYKLRAEQQALALGISTVEETEKQILELINKMETLAVNGFDSDLISRDELKQQLAKLNSGGKI